MPATGQVSDRGPWATTRRQPTAVAGGQSGQVSASRY